MNNLCLALRASIMAQEEMSDRASVLDQVEIVEARHDHALNTIECLVEANAALREQLSELKHARRSTDSAHKTAGGDVPRP